MGLGGVISTLTFDQSASNSSANISGSVVKVPCPISAVGARMVMVLSVAMLTHTLMAIRASLVWADVPMGSMALPIAKEKLSPEPTAKN